MATSGSFSITSFIMCSITFLHSSFLPGVFGCPEVCGSKIVPYPFGLAECGLPSFRLYCDDKLNLHLSLKTSNFTVLSLDPHYIIVDPLVHSNCSTPNVEHFSHLTGYAVSPNNTIQMYGCNYSTQCDNCRFYSELSSRDRPYSCPSSFCCDVLGNKSLQNLTVGCKSFSSWAVQAEISNDNVQVNLQLGLELQVVIPGSCSCSTNAKCTTVAEGHTCQCKGGFLGDGYAKGQGCHKNATRCNRKVLIGCAKNTTVMIAGIIAVTTVAVTVIIAYVVLRRRSIHVNSKRNRRAIQQIEGLLAMNGGASPTTLFPYKELEKATKGFSEQGKLGNGAFGTVYAGKLQDGRLVAVKRINYRFMQGIQQVVNEVKVLSAVDHPNLVRLLGCCLEYGDPLLVYEYIPNGTLAEHLHGQRGEGLAWATRITILVETAQALAYLHSMSPPIFHRDVKSSNILLDYDFTSKVADFGLSRLVLTESSHISTVPQGTPGYLDPEYHQNFHLSDKSDVYSFGVVLVEIITAKKAVDFTREKSEINLAVLALTKIANGKLDDIIDPSLEVFKQPHVRAMVHMVGEVAFRCLSYDKDARPTMMEVADELEFISNASKTGVGRLYRQPSSGRSRNLLRNTKKEASSKVRDVSGTPDVWASNDSSSNNSVTAEI